MRTRSWFVAVVLLVPTVLLAQRAGDIRDRAQIPYSVGMENMKAEAWDAAVQSFRAAAEIDPGFELAYYMLGRVHMAQKKFVDAIGAYEKCRDLYRSQLGKEFANAQERQRARETRLREIDEIIRSYQSGPQSTRTSDTIRQLQNRRREIEELMSRGQSTMGFETSVPSYVSTSLGSAYFRAGRLADAEREYVAAVAADSKAGEAHSNLAVVYMETGRLDAAEKAIKDAEKAGFKVHPELKAEIAARKRF